MPPAKLAEFTELHLLQFLAFFHQSMADDYTELFNQASELNKLLHDSDPLATPSPYMEFYQRLVEYHMIEVFSLENKILDLEAIKQDANG